MKMSVLPWRLVLGTLGVQMVAVSACGDSTTVDPLGEPGSIVVTVQTIAATAQASLDTDGYTVVTGLESRPIEPNGTVTFTDVAPGEHAVSLEELQVNCTTPESPTPATVVAGGTARVTFPVTCWPPTTGRIAFTSNRAGDEEIFSMNADGTDLVQLTTLGGHAFWPAWSPDGWRIAFTTSYMGNEDIFLINADGSGMTQLTSSNFPEETPTWSPDGSRVAFSRYSDLAWGPEDIYVIDSGGGGYEVRLTSHPARDYLPVWSPDGSRILFTSERDGNGEVYVMNADGSNPVNLTNNPASDAAWAGAWSPDGTKIVFKTGRTGDGEIFVMNADGSDPVNLTNSPLQEHGGSWSPDGSKVVFSRHPVGNIFIMNADGTGVVDVTNSGATLDRYPHWSWGRGDPGSTARSPVRPGPAGRR